VARRRLRVALIYGGRSGEHEVSVESARSVASAIDPTRYEVLPIGIDHDGAWLVAEPDAMLANGALDHPRVIPSADPSRPGLVPVDPAVETDIASPDLHQVDVAFPVVHGTFGEDGCLQGLLELAGIPYVGSGVLASAVSMDKIVMKELFKGHGFPVVDYVAIERTDWEKDPATAASVVERIGFPCFVKPSNLGSSVGIRKIHDRDELAAGLDHAAAFSARIIVERALDVREIECGVLGNHHPDASVVGEIVPAREFYDYEAKYHDDRTQFIIPADLPVETVDRVRALAVEAFMSMDGAGMARVDFFLERGTGQIYLNEINTIPGFTAMSVYPRLWAASGVPYPELIDRLVELALQRHADQGRNRTRYT